MWKTLCASAPLPEMHLSQLLQYNKNYINISDVAGFRINPILNKFFNKFGFLAHIDSY